MNSNPASTTPATEDSKTTRRARGSVTTELEIIDAITPFTKKIQTAVDDLLQKANEVASKSTLRPEVNLLAKRLNELTEDEFLLIKGQIDVALKFLKKD